MRYAMVTMRGAKTARGAVTSKITNAGSAMLRDGDQAPDFELEGDVPGTKDGSSHTVRLKDLRGRRVVLYFYPRDNTPGCTREAIDFSEALEKFEAAGTNVIGISRDTTRSHSKFREKHDLRIELLSDPDLVAHNLFDAYGEKTMYGKKVQGTLRSTFVIDEKGKVIRAFRNVKLEGHVEAVLDVLTRDGEPAPAPTSKTKKKRLPTATTARTTRET
jgi:thioredoxin-dependent peroxiredoxin